MYIYIQNIIQVIGDFKKDPSERENGGYASSNAKCSDYLEPAQEKQLT